MASFKNFFVFFSTSFFLLLGSCGGMNSSYVEDKLATELKLTRQQSQNLAQVSKAIHEMMQEFEKEGRAALWYEELFIDHEFKKTKALKLIEQKQRRLSQLLKELIPKIDTFYNSLDSKQKEKFHEVLEKFIKSRD